MYVYWWIWSKDYVLKYKGFFFSLNKPVSLILKTLFLNLIILFFVLFFFQSHFSVSIKVMPKSFTINISTKCLTSIMAHL